MSDLSAAAFAVLSFALVYFGLSSARRWPIYCAAVILGLSLCIRPQLLFMSPLLSPWLCFLPEIPGPIGLCIAALCLWYSQQPGSVFHF